MKTSSVTSWFVAVGVSAVVFIGAFAHFDPVAPLSPAATLPAKAVADEKLAPESAPEQPLRADPSPGMAEVVHLAESHVDPGVILAFIQNSGQTYSPTADEILYLSHLGVPQNVIAALFPPQSAPIAESPVAIPTTIPDAPPLPQEANSNLFTEALAPYGNWVQVPEYGAAWQPAVETANPDWKPYVDDGQWINSDSGWYWQSSYPWGWAPFHYGGWVNSAPLGWVWVPGRTWGPAWVSWRTTASYVGWAPLPPGVSLNVLSQLTFSGHPVSPEYDFGVTLSSYVFVRVSRFLNSNLPTHVVPAARSTTLAAASTVINNYSVANSKIINGGVSRSVVAAAAKQPLSEVVLEPVSSAPEPVSSPPTLLAMARGEDLSLPSMQLPPLHYGPPRSAVVKHEFAQEFGAEPYQRPFYHGSGPPPLPGQPRFGGEGRSAPQAPGHEAVPAASSGSKSAK